MDRARSGAVATETGVRAEVVSEAGAEVLRVQDASGRLLFEHRPAEGRSVVYAPEGAMDFEAERIGFTARDTVRVRGGRVVDVQGGHAVHIGTDGAEGRPASLLTLGARGVMVVAVALEARARRAELGVDEARLVARALSTAVETARHVAGVVDMEATRIVERAVDVYRDARELSQTTAGRIKLVASRTLHAVGRSAWVEGEDDLKLRGDKIHLG